MTEEKKAQQLFFAAQILINVHDLNNELTAGNVNEIRQIDLVTEDGATKTLPAVSGRMMKHWHYEYFRIEAIKQNLPLSDSVKNGEPIWPATKNQDGVWEQWDKPIKEILDKCAVSDVHGYLIATEKGGRRTSCVQFSWLLPVLYDGNADSYGLRQVIHSRVAKDPNAKVETEERPIQMPFNKYYASDLYGLVAYFDSWRVGRDETGALLISEDEQKKRIKIAIEAFHPLLSGKFGASQSHASPHVNPICVLAGLSFNSILPLPVSPIYKDWIQKTVANMPSDVKLLGTGEPLRGFNRIEYKAGLDELISEILNLAI